MLREQFGDLWEEKFGLEADLKDAGIPEKSKTSIRERLAILDGALGQKAVHVDRLALFWQSEEDAGREPDLGMLEADIPEGWEPP